MDPRLAIIDELDSEEEGEEQRAIDGGNQNRSTTFDRLLERARQLSAEHPAGRRVRMGRRTYFVPASEIQMDAELSLQLYLLESGGATGEQISQLVNQGWLSPEMEFAHLDQPELALLVRYQYAMVAGMRNNRDLIPTPPEHAGRGHPRRFWDGGFVEQLPPDELGHVREVLGEWATQGMGARVQDQVQVSASARLNEFLAQAMLRRPQGEETDDPDHVAGGDDHEQD